MFSELIYLGAFYVLSSFHCIYQLGDGNSPRNRFINRLLPSEHLPQLAWRLYRVVSRHISSHSNHHSHHKQEVKHNSNSISLRTLYARQAISKLARVISRPARGPFLAPCNCSPDSLPFFPGAFKESNIQTPSPPLFSPS